MKTKNIRILSLIILQALFITGCASNSKSKTSCGCGIYTVANYQMGMTIVNGDNRVRVDSYKIEPGQINLISYLEVKNYNLAKPTISVYFKDQTKSSWWLKVDISKTIATNGFNVDNEYMFFNYFDFSYKGVITFVFYADYSFENGDKIDCDFKIYEICSFTNRVYTESHYYITIGE